MSKKSILFLLILTLAFVCSCSPRNKIPNQALRDEGPRTHYVSVSTHNADWLREEGQSQPTQAPSESPKYDPYENRSRTIIVDVTPQLTSHVPVPNYGLPAPQVTTTVYPQTSYPSAETTSGPVQDDRGQILETIPITQVTAIDEIRTSIAAGTEVSLFVRGYNIANGMIGSYGEFVPNEVFNFLVRQSEFAVARTGVPVQGSIEVTGQDLIEVARAVNRRFFSTEIPRAPRLNGVEFAVDPIKRQVYAKVLIDTYPNTAYVDTFWGHDTSVSDTRHSGIIPLDEYIDKPDSRDGVIGHWGVKPGVQYCYRARAFTLDGRYKGLSNPVCGTHHWVVGPDGRPIQTGTL